MKKRYTVLGLSAFLALALVVPALGGPLNPVANISASAKSIANKALKKAKAAQTAANNAQSSANSAASAASGAQTTANSAKTAAAAAQTTATEALNSANGKMSGEVHVEEAGSSQTLAIAPCPTGKVPTGGGFIIGGANNNAATVTESTQYVNSWIVIADQIEGTTGSTWSTTATVNCATSP
jgi:hypothetical protein